MGLGERGIGQQPVGSVSNYPKHIEGVVIPLTVSELLYLQRRTFHLKPNLKEEKSRQVIYL